MFAAATIVVVAAAMLGTPCGALSVSDFEEYVGTCGVSPNENFKNRAEARANEFPWNAQLFYSLGRNRQRTSPLCEGTLINRNYVLTTASCLQSPELERLSGRIIFVRVGDWNRGSSSFTDIPVSTVRVHKQFDDSVRPQRNNIGLVKLRSDVDFSDSIQPICLPWSDTLSNKLFVNDELTTTGWGQSATERRATKKQKVKVTAVPTSQCTEKYQNSVIRFAIDDEYICAGGQHEYDTCAGYAGAPLMTLDDSTSHWTLIGQTSLGPADCATTGVPGIYTRVGVHIRWVLENIEI